MTENYVETLKKNFQWVSTRWTEFWPKITVLTKNWPETHFSTRSTWLDPYWPGGLGFGRKWWFWPETAWNSFFTLVDMVWPVLTWWTRFWSKMTVLTRNGMKLIFYPGRHGLTRIDPVDSVLVENDGFDPKRPETHFLPWSTWFDSYWPGGLGFDGKMRLTREKYIFEF